MINFGSHYGHGMERRKGDDLLGANSSYDCHGSNPCLSFPIQGCFLLLFSFPVYLSGPAPYPFVYPVSTITVPISHARFNIFNHILLSVPVFWFLTPVLWPLLSYMQVPPHSDFHWLCQTPSPLVFPPLESPDHGLSSLSAPGFFPSKFTLSQRNDADRVLAALVAQGELNRIIWF